MTCPQPPSPLSRASISLILELIVPPSLLTPLPPHLLSSALRQRHHFLHISSDDPADYLVWPAPDPPAQKKIIDLLESFQKPEEPHDYIIRYTSDSESTFAHVAISSRDPPGLRLVFQWNQPDGWAYHNLALMPFPPNTFESLQDLMLFEPHDFLDEPPIAVVGDDNSDSYWDSYGQSDTEDRVVSDPNKGDIQAGSEDAYWAQYSVVHGSGDSTLPTPPRVNQKRDVSDRVICAYPGLKPSTTYNPLVPPSPNTLAQRLANLSPRPESPALVDDSDSGSGSGSGSPTPSPPALTSIPLPDEATIPSVLVEAPSDHNPLVVPAASQPAIEAGDGDHEARQALKDTIRSVYRLWRLSGNTRKERTEDGEPFLDIVRQVVAEESLH
ncbi:hypothetical protein Hypma_015493 [Hypsizygus marmoreus]|uniref:Uncharacterized protein n=1 Tax=Hypsizygus marmoreus TaxID=39966 RepID=A0A369KCG4_HYPMA|nr:hypothetical protein Hypma_015493 [Hypsizygus marmoreus]